MRLAETVTFGGSGLDRAAELRGDAEAQATMLREGAVLPFWRGKILMEGDRLVRLKADERALGDLTAGPVFLGRDGVPHFAADVSAWEPPEGVPDSLGAFFDPSEQAVPDLPGTPRFAELRGAMTRLTPRDAELAATGKAILSWHRSHKFCAACGAPSEMRMAGWQRTCPSCGAHHFPRTDPVVIMLITHGNSVLLGRSNGWPEGLYSLLAGFVEPGETIEAAVRREVFEEAGVQVGPVRYLASQPWAFPSSLMFGCQGEALTREIKIDPAEIEDAIWLTREELMEVYAGQRSDLKPARKGAIAHFLLANWLSDRLDDAPSQPPRI